MSNVSGKSKSSASVADYCRAAAHKLDSVKRPGQSRVAVMMSGGVDSSTTALLLARAGYEVIGVTGWLVKSGSKCCDLGMLDAARVCEQLEIEHHAVDLRELFKHEVINQFHRSYASARTPLPCSLCNTVIKWGALYNWSLKQLGADLVATGHYARIINTESGPCLARARDRRKDQSYVLWGLTRQQLKTTLLPLGDYDKPEIRQIAADAGLVVANRPDSQDLCFIPEGESVKSYLATFLPESPGPIVHARTGAVLGEHTGTHNFTIGQRRGIGVSYPEPLYVVGLSPESRTVFVGPTDALLSGALEAGDINWLTSEDPKQPFAALAKIRYNSQAVPAVVHVQSKGRVKVEFAQPQPAVTPGQVLGLYDPTDTYLLGGGWIERGLF